MSSGFVTEGELAEARKRRQEEWEKVRTAEQPLERPDEPYDGRSLYDRLKEQKVKKDMEYEEAHKLKNLIRGLDDDEVHFLEQVDQGRMAAEHRQMQEEEKELKDFRKRVASLQEENADKLIQTEVKQTANKAKAVGSNTRPSQRDLLSSGIKRKNGELIAESTENKTAKSETIVNKTYASSPLDKGQFKCVAILPGIGPYTESSDSEASTGSDDEPGSLSPYKYDLVGRRKDKQAVQCHSGGNE